MHMPNAFQNRMTGSLERFFSTSWPTGLFATLISLANGIGATSCAFARSSVSSPLPPVISPNARSSSSGTIQ